MLLSPKRWAVLALLLLLPACAMQRAQDAETARRQMVGMDREQVFACMGIPARKASEGATEIWQYQSGNDHTERTKGEGRVSGKKAVSGSDLMDSLTTTFITGDEVREKRHCTVHVVMKEGKVQTVNYSGPTGGFLTEDEQCAFATRNCVKTGS